MLVLSSLGLRNYSPNRSYTPENESDPKFSVIEFRLDIGLVADNEVDNE